MSRTHFVIDLFLHAAACISIIYFFSQYVWWRAQATHLLETVGEHLAFKKIERKIYETKDKEEAKRLLVELQAKAQRLQELYEKSKLL